MPILWNPQDCLPKDAYERFKKLPMLERLEVGDKIRGPLFWILAKRAKEKTQTRPCHDDAELFWNLVPMAKTLSTHAVEDLVVQEARPWKTPVKRVGKDAVRIFRYDAWTSFHRIAEDMLDLIDGHRTLREIGHMVAANYQVPFDAIKDTMLRYFHQLIDEMTLATPDFTRCHGCPLRQREAAA